MAGSVAGTVWLTVDWIVTKKPKFLGFLTGAVAGLATITPASGFVQPWASFVIGFVAGIVCYAGAWSFKHKFKLDDALDVAGVHGVGGITGTLLLGCLATPDANPCIYFVVIV